MFKKRSFTASTQQHIKQSNAIDVTTNGDKIQTNHKSNKRIYSARHEPTDNGVERSLHHHHHHSVPLESDLTNTNIDSIEQQLDRDWYNSDETNTSLLLDDYSDTYDTYKQPINNHTNHNQQRSNKTNLKQQQWNDDNSRWESQVLGRTGTGASHPVAHHSVDLDETEDRISLYIHDIKPIFLSNESIDYNKNTMNDMISVVRDNSSDLVKLSRQTCRSMVEYRDKQERLRHEQLHARKSNTVQYGQIQRNTNSTVKNEPDNPPSNGKVNSQYAQHLSNHKPSAVSEFATTKSLQQQREYLPVYSVKNELLQLIHENQVIIVVGETGSGKTTQLTQYLYSAGYGAYGIIACTQPRRVAAISVAARVASEMNVTLGNEVGYIIRFEDITNKSTRIIYMTDGVLTRESLLSHELDKYSVIILDEAHERSLNTDVLFGILRELLIDRTDLKLIVTSATLDSIRFSEYFGGAPIYSIPGRTFPVDIMYSRSIPEDYIDASVKQILTVHMTQPVNGDILVFMTGQDDIECTCSILADKLQLLQSDSIESNGKQIAELLILPLYSQLPTDLQSRIFQPAPPNTRKVIIATNIAETSITIDGIKYVIDPGYSKLKSYNSRIGMDSLLVTPIAQSQANQRSGRAGRTGPGICWRLYTEYNYNNDMLQQSIPEIQRTNLGHVVLQLKSLQINDIREFSFMDAPPYNNILISQYQLWLLGALDNLGHITQLGRSMIQFPLDPLLSCIVLNGIRYDCILECITIVSMLSLPNIFFRPPDKTTESDSARDKFLIPESDHLTLLHVYQQWIANNKSSRWCQQHFIQHKAMIKVYDIREQLCDICTAHQIKLTSCDYNWTAVRRALCTAYYNNVAQLRGIGTYVNLRSQSVCLLHPNSAMNGYTSEYIIYHELILTSKQYMRIVTSIDPVWLADSAPHLFSVAKLGDSTTRLQIKQKEKYIIQSMQREASEYQQKQYSPLDKTKQQSNVQNNITSVGKK